MDGRMYTPLLKALAASQPTLEGAPPGKPTPHRPVSVHTGRIQPYSVVTLLVLSSASETGLEL